MKFARIVFTIATIFGLIVMPPMFFLEARIGQDYPPEITHPEFYYGFVGAVAIFQLLYLMIAYDPLRYRPLMLVGVLAKLAFVTSTVVLVALRRAPVEPAMLSIVDLILAPLFVAAFIKSGTTAKTTDKAAVKTSVKSTV
jgi:hypothetical protein